MHPDAPYRAEGTLAKGVVRHTWYGDGVLHPSQKVAPEVQAVRAGEAEIVAHAQVTRAAVLQGFEEAIEVARLRSDPSAMIAGWREIAKMCGYYAPERKQVQLSVDARVQRNELERMTDAELAELIAEGDRTQNLVPSTLD